MNFRDKFISEYISRIEDSKFVLNNREAEFFKNIKNLNQKSKPITPKQYNWLRDIAESIPKRNKK